MVEIRVCTIAEIEQAPNIRELLAEYAEASAIEGMPRPAAQMGQYRAMEASAGLHVIGAFQGNLLIGLITVLSSILPHYGARVSITESFYVLQGHRKTGAGLKLLDEAECYAQVSGSVGLLVSAPANGILAYVLPKRRYLKTNEIFFKGFVNV